MSSSDFGHIIDLFKQHDLNQKVLLWKEETSSMREIVNLFWCAEKYNLESFYKDIQFAELREAIVLASMEEISEVFKGLYVHEILNIKFKHFRTLMQNSFQYAVKSY